MKRIPLYIIAMLSFALLSCEKELEFNGREVKPQLVLHGFINAGDSVKVSLTHSRFFLSNIEIKDIKNANVTLWKDGAQLETLTYFAEYESRPGNYVGHYVPQPGDEITVKATAPGYDDISSTTKIPVPPTVVAVDTSSIFFKSSPMINYGYGVDENDTIGWCIDEEYNTVCRISDPGNEANYYRINAAIKWIYDNGEEYYFPLNIKTNDIVFGTSSSIGLGEGLDAESNRYNMFSDEYFNGSTYGVKFSWWFSYCSTDKGYDGSDPNQPKVIRRELHVSLQEISRDYYLYVKTLSAAEDSEGAFFGEPVQIYSNVKGGIGILGGSSTTVHKTVMRLN